MAAGDPLFSNARFQGRCTRCSRIIKRGEQIVYAPNTRRMFCTGEDCGQDIMRTIAAKHHQPRGER